PEVPVASAAVMHNGTLYTDAKGCTPQTLFQAASISKIVAALAALVLVDRGAITLDTDINKVMKSWQLPPALDDPQGVVTLGHLLGHSAGLSVRTTPGYASGTAPLPGLTDILNGAPASVTCPVRRKGRPGQDVRYSAGGYTVLQLLLTEVSGKS